MGPSFKGRKFKMRSKRSHHALLARFALAVDELLRGDSIESVEVVQTSHHLTRLIVIIITFGATYGAVMGSFGVLRADRWVGVFYSAVKVPMLLMVSFGISLPSFLVLNTVLGVRGDVRKVVAALVSMQAVLTVVLGALAPFTAFWY